MREYKCKHTGEVYQCFSAPPTGKTKMVNQQTGKEIDKYVTSAHSSIIYKFWDQSTIQVEPGELIDLSLSPGRPTHRKFTMQKRFTKINP